VNLESSKALVTGGAMRIGRALSEALAARGCGVVVHYDESADEAAELVKSLIGSGVAAFAVKSHLWSQEDCETVMAEAWDRSGGIDIVVNNAAVFHKDTLMSASIEKLLTEVRVNCAVPMMLTREFARRKKEGTMGAVVNLLDRRIAGDDVGCFPYVLSKKMLAEYTRSAALELAPYIRVNGVAPGAVLPPRTGSAHDVVRDAAGNVPLERQCTPEDVASAVIFLLESDAVTGQTIFVDGGQHLI